MPAAVASADLLYLKFGDRIPVAKFQLTQLLKYEIRMLWDNLLRLAN